MGKLGELVDELVRGVLIWSVEARAEERTLL